MNNENIILQPSERILMERLWDSAPQTSTMLINSLKENPGWSKSTVNTMIKRMTEKNLIRFEEGGKAKQYYPAVERENVNFAETDSFIQRVFNGSVSMMMSTLLKEKKLSSDEIDELHKILDDMEE